MEGERVLGIPGYCSHDDGDDDGAHDDDDVGDDGDDDVVDGADGEEEEGYDEGVWF